eukprot:TRINITY_DN20623_c0_g1_i3.p1 TRINITY_DN20623_c0_g1~~TRINITY_DN20623_c0_g1_i3.p1  ORF type:complete len:782 (+),score=158.19 TRINITY_DN20623_c0_g1_i3:555-2900(+)
MVNLGNTFALFAQDEVICEHVRGRVFGGRALLFKSIKRTTVVAAEASSVWAVKGNTFWETLLSDERRNKMMDCVEIFSGLSCDRKIHASELAYFCSSHEAGERIVTEGAEVSAICLLRTGEMSVVKGGSLDASGKLTGGSVVGKLKAGDTFGKTAAWGGTSKVSVVTETRCELDCLDTDKLKVALGSNIGFALERSHVQVCLEQSTFISQFNSVQLRRIAEAMDFVELGPGEELSKAHEFLVVVRGDLRREHEDVAYLARGALAELPSFTEVEMRKPMKRLSHRNASARLSQPIMDKWTLSGLVAGPVGARIATLTHENLRVALQECGISCSSEAIMETARKAIVSKKVPIFHHLTGDQVDEVVQSMIHVRLERGALVFEQNSASTDFYVVASGEIEELVDGQRTLTHGKHGCVGFRGLILDNNRRCTARVSSEVAELWQLERETFDRIFSDASREGFLQRARLHVTDLHLKDLRHIRAIGTGSFGTVREVQSNSMKQRYALKRVRNNDQLDNVRQECVLLAEFSDHPLILHLVRTIEVESGFYMLTELLPGGELLAALDRIGRLLNRWEAQFYTGTLALALEFLRDRNVVYRDLKPENVMLDSQGFLKLIDFGTAKKLKDFRDRTYTVIGSFHFMAPEVWTRRGYGVEVDIWSLGVMVFEFVCGYLPFGRDIPVWDDLKIAAAAQKENLHFPSTCVDIEAKHLLRGLLRKNPAERLGTGIEGIDGVKDHSFFKLDDPVCLFDMILTRQLGDRLPPFVPSRDSLIEAVAEPDVFSDAGELG